MNKLNILVENNLIEGPQHLDFETGYNSFSEIDDELDKLLNS